MTEWPACSAATKAGRGEGGGCWLDSKASRTRPQVFRSLLENRQSRKGLPCFLEGAFFPNFADFSARSPLLFRRSLHQLCFPETSAPPPGHVCSRSSAVGRPPSLMRVLFCSPFLCASKPIFIIFFLSVFVFVVRRCSLALFISFINPY